MGFPVVYGVSIPPAIFKTLIVIGHVSNAFSVMFNQLLHRGRGSSSQRDGDVDPAEFSRGSEFTQLYIYESDFNLAEEIRASLPVVNYHASLIAYDELGAQCTVCLCELEEEDEVRQLPHCKHTFHKNCLDSWLDIPHTTCPLCRKSVLTEALNKRSSQLDQAMAAEMALLFSPYDHMAPGGFWWQPQTGSVLLSY